MRSFGMAIVQEHRERVREVWRPDQAADLPSICRRFEADEPSFEIWRGFMASGISRTSSIFSRPLSKAAPLTWT
jgi:hypothetical protein